MHFLSGGEGGKDAAHSLVLERPAGCSGGTDWESPVAPDAPLGSYGSYGTRVVGELAVAR